jgi:DNA-binding NarL/FixJ family response regulator
MARACCLVGVAPEDTPRLTAALNAAVSAADVTVALLDLAMLSAMGPELMILDIDRLRIEPLEALRQLRFVLPNAAIVVYTSSTQRTLIRDCHNAGANCLLSKSSTVSQLATGLRHAMSSGCYTDPRLAA